MTFYQWLVAIGPPAALITSAIALIGRLYWTKEYKEAKEAQIEALRELTPVKVKEAFDATKVVLSEHIDNLKQQVDDMQEKLRVSEQKIEELTLESAQKPTDQRVQRLLDIVRSSNAQIKIDATQMNKIIEDSARAASILWAELQIPDPPSKSEPQRGAFEGLSTMPKRKKVKE